MKAVLEFNLPEEQNEFDLATKASKMYSALFDIRSQIFRPARKHGYGDEDLDKLFKSDFAALELIGRLEELFNEVLQDNELEELDI